MHAPDRIIAIVGPTATGKSDLGIAVAHAIGGPEAAEIVNADAYQLYQGMDIGSAKVPVALRRDIVHHLVDLWDVSEEASVARYQQLARACVADIVERGKTPIVVGGSGLYVRALLDEMEFPGTDATIRAELEAELENGGARPLYEQLRAADPAAAAAIGAANARRIVRALEVIRLTGRPYTATLPQQRYVRPAVQIGLDYDRQSLDERVAVRVERMWELGIVAETQRLAGPELTAMGRTAQRGVGYAQVLAALRGEMSMEQAKEQTVVATRRLARKQMGWFGRDERVHWLRADAGDPAALVDAAVTIATGPISSGDASRPRQRRLGS